MQVIGDRVIVRVLKKPGRTAGGIYLSEGARKQDLEGVVYFVGTGRLLKCGKRVPPDLKPGDRVLVEHWWTGQPVKLPDAKEDQEFISVKSNEISGVLEG